MRSASARMRLDVILGIVIAEAMLDASQEHSRYEDSLLSFPI